MRIRSLLAAAAAIAFGATLATAAPTPHSTGAGVHLAAADAGSAAQGEKPAPKKTHHKKTASHRKGKGTSGNKKAQTPT